jgi:hypothetical protein
VALALVDDRTVTLPIRLGGEEPRLLTERALWEQDLLNEQLTLDDMFKSLNEEIGKADRRTAAVDRARKALERLNARLQIYAEDRGNLAKSKPPAGGKPIDLSKGDRRLADIRRGRDDLKDFVTRMEAIVKEENSPEAQQAKADVEQARNLEIAGDYGRAIELYEKVLARTKDAALKLRLDNLKKAWEPKSDEHRAARAFIYDTWPELVAPAAMNERIKQAQAALAACRKAGDPLGPRKLLRVANSHANKLSQELEKLEPNFNAGDVKPAEELDKVLDLLGKLIKDATADVAKTPLP